MGLNSGSHFLTVQPLISPLTFLCFHFNIYKMRTIIVTTHRVFVRIREVNICKLLRRVPGK